MTSLDFTADPIPSLNTIGHSFGALEARDSTDVQPLGYACLRVEGEDAAVFLQGQMTAEIATQTVGQCRVTALCNPKGRVIASMDIARFSDNIFALILANRLLEAVKTTLSRYIMRSKVNITPWPDQSLVCLVHIEQAPAVGTCELDEAGSFRCHPAWLPASSPDWVLSNSAADFSPPSGDSDDDLSWAHAHVLFGIAPPKPATELQHIPQMLNLDALDGISMTKGCYTGQEIIARVHHRGSVKRRLRRFVVTTAAKIEPGDVVETSSGSNAGMVVEVATDDHNHVGVLAVIKESDFASDSVLTSSGATLEHWPIPYPI